MATKGRPRVLTDEQRKENMKASIAKYRRENREKYNAVVRTYSQNNREKIRRQQRERYRQLTAHKKSPFYVPPDITSPNEDQQAALTRMSELIRQFCTEKKSKGSNYLQITHKPVYREIMEGIGFTDEKDVWISRSWMEMPLKILGWKDIHKLSPDKIGEIKKKMIDYGKEKWMSEN